MSTTTQNNAPPAAPGSEWLTELGVKPGEWYQRPKARPRRMMLNHLSKEARQVYECLELHTMAYRRERAVIQDSKGTLRALTRRDIARETQLTEANVRRGLKALEREGLAERRSTAADGSLHAGSIEIHCFAVPLKNETAKKESRATPFDHPPEWFPPEWQQIVPLLSRLKIQLADTIPLEEGDARDSFFRDVLEVARVAIEAEKGFARLLETVRATPPNLAAYRKKESSIERRERTAAAAEKGTGIPPSPDSPPPPPPRTPPSTDPEPAPAPQPRPEPAAAIGPALEQETEQVTACLSQYGPADHGAGRQMLTKCRQHAPDAPAAAICTFIERKGPEARQARKAIGFLLHSVPAFFEGNWRGLLELPPPRAEESPAERRQREAIERRVRGMTRLQNLNLRFNPS